jgi:hypothetical protein
MAGLDPSPPGRPTAKYNGSASDSEDRARRRAGALRSRSGIGASALLAAGAARLLDRFGFSWTVAVLPLDGPKTRVGFPWISLDSLVRIETLQWVTRDSPRKKFRALFCRSTARCDRSRCSYHAETQCRSSNKSNSFSAFLQSMPAQKLSIFCRAPDGALRRLF